MRYGMFAEDRSSLQTNCGFFAFHGFSICPAPKTFFSFSGDFFLFAAVGLVETWKNGVLN